MEQENTSFITKLYAPAKRALANKGIDSLEKLSKYSIKELLKLHGIGKTSIPVLEEELHTANLRFKEDE